MKNKIAIASAFIAASSFSTAEIVVNDFLSFEGFVDMSYMHIENEVGNVEESDNSYQVDQVEISWLFDFDPVTAQIDLNYEGGAAPAGNIVEQAFATYDLGNGGAITAGRYASMIGFEAFEPTGLYQYSFGYDLHVLAGDLTFIDGLTTAVATLDFGDVTIIPGYAQGIKYTYETDNTFFGISIQDEVFDYDGDRLGGDDASSYGVEIAFSIAFDNGLSWFVGGAYEDADEAEGDSYMLNTYVTFETGAWIFAAEASYGESEADSFALGNAAALIDAALVGAANAIIPTSDLGDFYADGDEEALQLLLMANFAYSDQASVTGRLSYVDHELDFAGNSLELDAVKATLAHGYAFTDNLFLVNEISYVDGEFEGLGFSEDFESILVAAELIFTF